MNNNNLENEKLPVNEEAKTEESTNELPQEEKVSEESVEITFKEPVEVEEKIVESDDAIKTEPEKGSETEVEPEKRPESEAESELKTETEAVEEVIEDEKEIDYDIETFEDDSEKVEEEADEVDENSVSDDDSAELLSIEEIVQKLRDLLASEHPQRKEVDEVKNQFYRSLRNETETQKAAFLESGGESIDFVVDESEIYAEGKELIQKIKEKRAEILAREDAEKEINVAKKWLSLSR